MLHVSYVIIVIFGDSVKRALQQPYKQFFGTLANQIRLDIIKFLRQGPRNVSEITTSLNIEQSATSHNLKRLETCGFVTVKQKGKERIYSLNEKTIKPLLALMDMHMKNYCRHTIKHAEGEYDKD